MDKEKIHDLEDSNSPRKQSNGEQIIEFDSRLVKKKKADGDELSSSAGRLATPSRTRYDTAGSETSSPMVAYSNPNTSRPRKVSFSASYAALVSLNDSQDRRATTDDDQHHLCPPESHSRFQSRSSTEWFDCTDNDADCDNQNHSKINNYNHHGNGTGLVTEEKSLTISIRDWSTVPHLTEVVVPLLFAGCGMMAAGVLLDHAQFWPYFAELEQSLILVPALCGAQGNVLLMLGSRLTTLASDGKVHSANWWRIAFANLALALARAIPAGFMATLAAMLLCVIKQATGWREDGSDGGDSLVHSLQISAVLAVSATYTMCVVTPMLGITVIVLITICKKRRHNPDAVALPIVTSLGDLSTMGLLAHIGHGFYSTWLTAGLAPILIAYGLLVLLGIGLLVLAYRNENTREDVTTGWLPILFAMSISSCAGLILARVADQFVHYAIFQPIVSGIAGGLAAVQTSNLSTRLHQLYDKPGCLVSRFAVSHSHRNRSVSDSLSADSGSGSGDHLKTVASSQSTENANHKCCRSVSHAVVSAATKLWRLVSCNSVVVEEDDCDTFTRSSCPNPYRTFVGLHTLARTNRLLCYSAIPAHLCCIMFIYFLNFSQKPFFSLLYIGLYMGAIIIQIMLLLYMTHWLVQFLWKHSYDPDNSASPYITAAGDVIGSLLLGCVFGLVSITMPSDHIVELNTNLKSSDLGAALNVSLSASTNSSSTLAIA